MKAKLLPIYFVSAEDPDFKAQMSALKSLLSDEAEFLDPVLVGSPIPQCDCVVFPQMLGAAFNKVNEIQALPQPIMVVTSEFGTESMWDWEINTYLRSKGIQVIAPYTLEKAKIACRAFALKRKLKGSKILAYQDNPGQGGKQDEIFKRFYWWEDECTESIETGYGLKILKKSFKALSESARAIPDGEAKKVWAEKKSLTPIGPLKPKAILGAVKLYMQIKADLQADPSIIAVGMNCLNESHFCETTPCLAWNWLYEEGQMVWGCEGDTVTMLTEVLIDKTLHVPFMMTNLYPFLMGQTALKHENIPYFPEVEGDPANHILVAHCGYLGVVPRSFSTEWKLKEKVLAIVNDNASAIDARLPEGPITLVKLVPPFDRWSIIEGKLDHYAQFKNSDCLNGGVLEVKDGARLLEEVVSHHYILTAGHNRNDLEIVAKVFNLENMLLN